ncbi:hypothetical protein DEU56DRAFT_762179 [Suillus clintonianus]|uniref:uncharacterized protein n=1 Tax=Suillus clintonianus TaxID=1904413 RepID=UPI001B874CB4|nr:uncharacterized protein DEU56DRAFT_762179 [Suillus clintonianus]KAG2111473.1 hypothetical protein DEU56DRAFT_762179 [Suillus clintonianus]
MSCLRPSVLTVEFLARRFLHVFAYTWYLVRSTRLPVPIPGTLPVSHTCRSVFSASLPSSLFPSLILEELLSELSPWVDYYSRTQQDRGPGYLFRDTQPRKPTLFFPAHGDANGPYYRQRIRTLEKENLELRTECNTIQNAFNTLANCVGLRNADAKFFTPPAGPDAMTGMTHTQSLPERPPPLDRNDYDTKFWDFDEWKKWSNSAEGRGSIKTRGSAPFLEDGHGDALTSASVDAIRRTMRRLFEMMASKDIAPPSWGRLSEHAYLLFHIGVGTTHPELRLCSNDWKANIRKTLPHKARQRYAKLCKLE